MVQEKDTLQKPESGHFNDRFHTKAASPDIMNLSDAGNTPQDIFEKLADALTPGYHAEFDPLEAEISGAFIEDALSEEDAAESDIDLPSLAIPSFKE